jgi:hypothetical protein
MKHTLWTALGAVVLATVACGTKKEETVPPGFCSTSAECQPIADRQQGYQNALRDRLKAQGVHDQYLPCGTYKPAKVPNGYWAVTEDKTGCLATASQQDPSPDPGKARQFKR